MDGQNDWDLSAVVRSCNNLNANSFTQQNDLDNLNGNSFTQQNALNHLNGDFPSQTYDSHNQSHGLGGDFPNSHNQRRYFGLEEVIERFMLRKTSEVSLEDSQANPPNLQEARASGGMVVKLPHRRVKEVRVIEVGVEIVGEWDGWDWRKYGNKMMCDSPHSKSYFRCNYEPIKCPAKKHVQQSQEDETKFIVTYRGRHNHPPPNPTTTTRRRRRNLALPPRPPPSPVAFPPLPPPPDQRESSVS